MALATAIVREVDAGATGTDLAGRCAPASASRENLQRPIEAVWRVRADRGAEERRAWTGR